MNNQLLRKNFPKINISKNIYNSHFYLKIIIARVNNFTVGHLQDFKRTFHEYRLKICNRTVKYST